MGNAPNRGKRIPAMVLFHSLLAAASATAAVTQPNIVWIMADDMGYGEVGLFPAGSKHGRISTPNLDQFGREGMQFTNAYAGYTVCAPSRTTLMTGYHSGHFGREGLSGTDFPNTQKVLTVGEMLQKAGYATAGTGCLD